MTRLVFSYLFILFFFSFPLQFLLFFAGSALRRAEESPAKKVTAGAVLLSYGQIPAACDQLGNLIPSPAPRHTRARLKVTLKRGLRVLQAQNLGGTASPQLLPSIPGVWEREGWCQVREDARARCAGLGGSRGWERCRWRGELGWGELEHQQEGSWCTGDTGMAWDMVYLIRVGYLVNLGHLGHAGYLEYMGYLEH